VDFASETIQHGSLRAEIISFVLADPSPAVRKSLLSGIWWAMSPEEVARISETLDDDLFTSLIEKVPMRFLPQSIRPRAAAAYTRVAETSEDGNRRLAVWSEAARLGERHAIDKLKAELSGANNEQVGRLAQRNLESIVDLIRTTDTEWVTAWVTQGIFAGALHGDAWMRMVSGISAALRDELLDRVTTEDLSEKRVPGVIPLLRAFPDAEIVRRLFRRLCELRPVIATSRPGDDKQAEAKVARQLEELIREMPPNIVVKSILRELGGNAGAVEIEVIAEIFNAAGRAASPLREVLSRELREEFRRYLKTAMATVLAQHDPHGHVKAYFATVLAQVGDASDLSEIERLIRADLERIRAERSARIGASTRRRRGARP